MKKVHLIWRALIFTARDMFIGFILGIVATVLLYKINPATLGVVALLIPAGVFAGIFKGVTKFIFLNIFSAVPSKGNRFNYPKYKLLLLWVAVLFGALVYSFGLNVKTWFSVPLRLLKSNVILGVIGNTGWILLTVLISLAGLIAHFYEPPYNENEFLPPVEPADNGTPEEN